MYTTERDFVASPDLSENIKRIRYRYSRYILAMYSASVEYVSRLAIESVSEFCQEAVRSKIQNGHRF